MANYYITFAGETTGSPPANFTPRWSGTGGTYSVVAGSAYLSGKALQEVSTDTTMRLYSWDTPDAHLDQEMLVRVKLSSTSSGRLFLTVRGSGSSGDQHGYVLRNNGSSQVNIYRAQGAGLSGSLLSLAYTLNTTEYFWIRFRAERDGSTDRVKFKIWSEHLAEPATWNEYSTTTLEAGTWIGVGSHAGGTQIFDDLAVGTAGDTASFPASEGGRDTSAALLVLGGVVSDPRVTHSALLALAIPVADPRATKSNMVALVEYIPDSRLTQSPLLVLADHVPCLTKWTQCCTITRKDGQVFAYTSLDRPILFRGVWHMPCDSMLATASDLSVSGGGSGNIDLKGVLSDTGISESDIYNGLFDGAFVEVWVVPWENEPGMVEIPLRLMGGTVGTAEHTVDQFTFEIITDVARLKQQPLLEVYSASCRYNFGTQNDSRCPVDLATITVSGAVTSLAIPDASRTAVRRIFGDSSRGEATGHFALGNLTWTSGANAGATSEIKDFNGGTFVLWGTMLHPIEIGDTYTAYPGCDKSPTAHLVYNASMTDFGGFPDVPGNDAINQTPDSKA